jgi:hypothetical protein
VILRVLVFSGGVGRELIALFLVINVQGISA